MSIPDFARAAIEADGRRIRALVVGAALAGGCIGFGLFWLLS